MPDHVHVFLKAPPTIAPQHIANQMKGFTSHTLQPRGCLRRSDLRAARYWPVGGGVERDGATTRARICRSAS
jgi:REP element-mobilizing transposase RayT